MNVSDARTWLFVPGDKPERFSKAFSSGADMVIADLEDAVAPEGKPAARENVVRALAGGLPIAVRVNGDDVEFHRDVEAFQRTASQPVAIIVSKSEGAARLKSLRLTFTGPLIPLIETARGLSNIAEIAACSNVARVAFGAVDYCLDIGSERSREALAFPRTTLVIASRVAEIAAPIDTPTLEYGDLAMVEEDAREARRAGMRGKLCIHPAQIRAVERGFAPTEAEILRANTVLAASASEGAGSMGSQMIDRPVFEWARQVLQESQATR